MRGVETRLEYRTPICLRSTLGADKEIASAARRTGNRKNYHELPGVGPVGREARGWRRPHGGTGRRRKQETPCRSSKGPARRNSTNPRLARPVESNAAGPQYRISPLQPAILPLLLGLAGIARIARVFGRARIAGVARIFLGRARIARVARVFGRARIARVFSRARIAGVLGSHGIAGIGRSAERCGGGHHNGSTNTPHNCEHEHGICPSRTHDPFHIFLLYRD